MDKNKIGNQKPIYSPRLPMHIFRFELIGISQIEIFNYINKYTVQSGFFLSYINYLRMINCYHKLFILMTCFWVIFKYLKQKEKKANNFQTQTETMKLEVTNQVTYS